MSTTSRRSAASDQSAGGVTSATPPAAASTRAWSVRQLTAAARSAGPESADAKPISSGALPAATASAVVTRC
eukprot:2109778-Pleurochrysis_carterae.AAC.1